MSFQAGFRDRLRYRLDTILGRGSGALFLALLFAFLGSFALIIALRALLQLIAPDPVNSFLAQIWFIFLELTDPGNMGQDTDTPGPFKLGAVVAGVTGVVIFSALIAFLTTALDQALAHLKKGHSRVLESGHTLILGWGPRVVEILRELVEANESEDDPVVVILAEEDKEEIDELLRTSFTDRRNTRLVTRSGSASSLQSLERVSAHLAKSAIVLASCDAAASLDEKHGSDAKAIKAVLALHAHTAHRDDFNVVAEVFDPRNREVVQEISPSHVVAVDAEEILAKIMVQTSRTSGLAVVYSELLSFEGCEIYFHQLPATNVPFGQLQFHFPDGVPIGMCRADGELMVRPALDVVPAPGDEILIVANDDSTIELLPQPVVTPAELQNPGRQVRRRKERMAILGWSPKARILISEYADYVLEGSGVDVVLHKPTAAIASEVEALRAELPTVSLRLVDLDPLDSAALASLEPFAYDNLVILPQRPGEESDVERIDAETIVLLLHLRRMTRALQAQGTPPRTKIITEVLDSANQELVSQAGVDDFLISNRMVSMIFAQLSEEPRILKVYDDIFEESGSEIYVKPAELYFERLPVTCRFADLMRAAQLRDAEVCLGYKLKAQENDGDRNYGVNLIPPKDAQVSLAAGDSLVVVAEDDR